MDSFKNYFMIKICLNKKRNNNNKKGRKKRRRVIITNKNPKNDKF
jgi:hypothetical protein